MTKLRLNKGALKIPGGQILSTAVPLCSACSRFDFSQLFRPFHGREGRNFSDVYQWHSYDLSCSNCRAIKEFGLGNGPVAEERAGLYMRESDSYKDENGMRVFTSQLYLWGFDPCIIPPLLDPYPFSQPKNLEILLSTRLVGAHFNVELLKLWLDCCDAHHGLRCHPSLTRKFVPFRLIDVQERRVIKYSEGLQYVSLSYVWGSQTVPQLKLTGQTCARLFAVNGLGDEHLDIPKTIRDAISFCQSVGRRYLWIDAVCIIQDDPEEMGNEISHMNEMYANAEFTIVACGGEDSWAGLPGVSERVVKQKTRTITGRPVATHLSSFQESMEGSIWSSRAWTLQEEFFSSRLLYFTPIQVFFHCREADWREDRCLEAPVDWDVRSENSEDQNQKNRSIRHDGALPSLNAYQDLVQDYSMRYLTNTRDNLNAFAGITNSISSAGDSESFWGLPVNFFENSLRVVDPSTLNAHDLNFPSWCWAAWLGPRNDKSKQLHGVQFLCCDSLNKRTYSATQWHRLQDSEEYIRLKIQPKEGQVLSNMLALWSTKPPSLLSRFISFFSIEIHLDRTSLPLVPTSLLLGPAPQGLSKHERSKLLVFRAFCSWMQYEVPTYNFVHDGLHGHPRVSAHPGSHPNAAKRISGTVQLEFVLIAVRWDTYDPAAEDLPQLVLLGIATNGRGISRRIYNAIDDVSMRCWIASKPVARTIFLM